MLKLGGILNIVIAVGHIIGLFWAKEMYDITGVGEPMQMLTDIHPSIPFLITIVVAIVFFLFGLYGLQAGGAKLIIKAELPYVKRVIFVIAAIYLFRGIGEQGYAMISGMTNTSETIQSVVAVVIGSLYLIGGVRNDWVE